MLLLFLTFSLNPSFTQSATILIHIMIDYYNTTSFCCRCYCCERSIAQQQAPYVGNKESRESRRTALSMAPAIGKAQAHRWPCLVKGLDDATTHKKVCRVPDDRITLYLSINHLPHTHTCMPLNRLQCKDLSWIFKALQLITSYSDLLVVQTEHTVT